MPAIDRSLSNACRYGLLTDAPQSTHAAAASLLHVLAASGGDIWDGGDAPAEWTESPGENDELCIEIDELCSKNVEFCSKVDEICIKNDEFCIKKPRGSGRRALIWA